ncbi:hypothetical protein HYV86_02905 [Candidatus Woesearchaeota archaeon]|nr:hypothetical protein [Candidatus Woesearchaeota archaeon]
MSPWLLLFLIIIGNLCLYWIFFGKKRFESKFIDPFDTRIEHVEQKIGDENGRQNTSR